LIQELAKSKTGVGLSAIQIGIPKRMAIIKLSNQKLLTIWNAEIINHQGSVLGEEGCLSVPFKFVNVPRHREITLKNGDGKILKFLDWTARIIEHEMDHWRGVLITDYEGTQDYGI